MKEIGLKGVVSRPGESVDDDIRSPAPLAGVLTEERRTWRSRVSLRAVGKAAKASRISRVGRKGTTAVRRDAPEVVAESGQHPVEQNDEAATRLGVERSLVSHPPVLALTLLRRVGERNEVLVGVRTPHNGTHQNVMSVPTIRVLSEVAREWTGPLADGVLSQAELHRLAFEPTVRHVVREIMALKLGKADALERGEVRFEVEAMLAVQGTSLLASSGGEDVTEDLTMFNAQVRWTAGHGFDGGRFGRTASYDPLIWITEEQFGQMVRTRDVGVLEAGLDEIEVCVRGLCIESTSRMLTT